MGSCDSSGTIRSKKNDDQFYRLLVKADYKQARKIHQENHKDYQAVIQSFYSMQNFFQGHVLNYLYFYDQFKVIKDIHDYQQKRKINGNSWKGNYQIKNLQVEDINVLKLNKEGQNNKKLAVQIDLFIKMQKLKKLRKLYVQVDKKAIFSSISKEADQLTDMKFDELRLSIEKFSQQNTKSLKETMPPLYYNEWESYIKQLQKPSIWADNIPTVKDALKEAFGLFDKYKYERCQVLISKRWLNDCKAFAYNDEKRHFPGPITHLDIAFLNLLDSNYPFIHIHKELNKDTTENINQTLWKELAKYFNGVMIKQKKQQSEPQNREKTDNQPTNTSNPQPSNAEPDNEAISIVADQNFPLKHFQQESYRHVQYIVGFKAQEIKREQKKSIDLRRQGIENLGNTCYMNCVLQCLKNSVFLVAQIDLFISQNKNKDQFMKQLDNIFKFPQKDKDNKPCYPVALKHEIGSYNPDFNNNGQHDSGQLLSNLLNLIAERTNVAEKQKLFQPIEPDQGDTCAEIYQQYVDRDNKQQESIVTNIVNGRFKVSYTCPNCDKKKISFQKYTLLYLPIPLYSKHKKVDFMECIEQYQKDEYLRMQCKKCSQKKGKETDTKHTKQLQIYTVNKMIVFCFKRFDEDGNKLENLIQIPLMLEINKMKEKIAKRQTKGEDQEERGKIEQNDELRVQKRQIEDLNIENSASNRENLSLIDYDQNDNHKPTQEQEENKGQSKDNSQKKNSHSSKCQPKHYNKGDLLIHPQEDPQNQLKKKNIQRRRRIKKKQENKEKPQKVTAKYELYAFIYHSGNRQSGHYISCCKSTKYDNKWLIYNDQRVTIEEALPMKYLEKAYILFYQEVEQ